MDKTPEDQMIEARLAAIANTLAKNAQDAAAPPRYLTISQSILGSILIILTFMSGAYGYIQGVQGQIESERERMVKVEYQNQVSITDRAEIHAALSTTNSAINEINTHLARMDTTLQAIADRQNDTAK